MAEAPVLGAAGKKSSVKLDDDVFDVRFNEALVHQCVRAEQAARRRGTAATRTRGMVAGGGSKPWRQKGTGRARAGSIRSPLWTGGGTVFGPQPRSYTFKVNRKEHRAALRAALSLHAGRGSLAVLEPDAFGEPRTRSARELLEEWDAGRPTLVVLAGAESAAVLSFRNLRDVAVCEHQDLGVADLLGAASVLISRPSLDALRARVGSPRRERAANEGPTGSQEPSAGGGGEVEKATPKSGRRRVRQGRPETESDHQNAGQEDPQGSS